MAYFGLTLWSMLTFRPMVTSKLTGGWIHWPNMQILFKFKFNRMKCEDFRTFGSNWPISYVDLFGRSNFTKLQCVTIAESVTLISENLGWLSGLGWRWVDRQTNTQTHKQMEAINILVKKFFFCQVTNKLTQMQYPLRILRQG